MLDKRKENENRRYFEHCINKSVLTPEETILAEMQDFTMRLWRSGFTVQETNEAILTWTDPDGGPAEYK